MNKILGFLKNILTFLISMFWACFNAIWLFLIITIVGFITLTIVGFTIPNDIRIGYLYPFMLAKTNDFCLVVGSFSIGYMFKKELIQRNITVKKLNTKIKSKGGE